MAKDAKYTTNFVNRELGGQRSGAYLPEFNDGDAGKVVGVAEKDGELKYTLLTGVGIELPTGGTPGQALIKTEDGEAWGDVIPPVNAASQDKYLMNDGEWVFWAKPITQLWVTTSAEPISGGDYYTNTFSHTPNNVDAAIRQGLLPIIYNTKKGTYGHLAQRQVLTSTQTRLTFYFERYDFQNEALYVDMFIGDTYSNSWYGQSFVYPLDNQYNSSL